MKKEEIIVFTGSTITALECLDILDAIYLPPAQCGDILSILRLQPKVIVLVDGNFETCASVWHKEILYALSLGVKVFGSSSMGALRATELARFGMVGHGTIFNWYSSGEINEDDEVALLHGPEELNFINLTVPLVNIRATVREIIESNFKFKGVGKLFIDNAREIFYQDRSHKALSEIFILIKGEPEGVEFEALVEKLGYVNQKKKDAISLLVLLAKRVEREAPPVVAALDFSNTIFFNKLFVDVMCRPLRVFHEAFPANEKRALGFKNLPIFGLVVRLAKCLPFCYALLFQKDTLCENVFERSEQVRRKLHEHISWHGIDQQEQLEVIRCLFMLFGLYKIEENENLTDNYIKDYIKDHEHGKVFLLTSQCWFLINSFCIKEKISPSKERIIRLSDDVRKARGLHNKLEMNRWLFHHNMSDNKWFKLITSYDRLTFISDNFSNILDTQQFELNRNFYWFDEALTLLNLKETTSNVL